MIKIPKNKKILLFLVPLTYTSNKKLSAIGIIPPNFLKIIKFLKSNKNKVNVINIYPGDEALIKKETNFFWKYKNLGIEGIKKTKVFVNSSCSFEAIKEKLKNIDLKPDEIWITSSFTYNYDLALDYIKIFKKRFPNSKIILAGNIAKYNEIIEKIKPDNFFPNNIPDIENFEMDFSEIDNINYGVFSIQQGCPFKCSFCNNERKNEITKWHIIKSELEYIRDKIIPQNIWNFDPNILLIGPKNFLKFIEIYKNLKINSKLSFYKGFQPNLVTKQILETLKEIKLYWLTIPFDATTYRSHIQFNKPYTIISSIKVINSILNNKIEVDTIVTSSVIGYPDDDPHHLIRSFLLSWYFKTLYAVSPVAIMPNTFDYFKYFNIIKHKDISDLDGRLWPLIPTDKLKIYKKLFKLMTMKEERNDIKYLIKFLPNSFVDIFYKEMKNVKKFVEYCLEAKNNTIEELKKIEEAIYGKLK